MEYWIYNDSDEQLNATITIEDRAFTLHSRGGSKSSENEIQALLVTLSQLGLGKELFYKAYRYIEEHY